jgi:hypothetical protein
VQSFSQGSYSSSTAANAAATLAGAILQHYRTADALADELLGVYTVAPFDIKWYRVSDGSLYSGSVKGMDVSRGIEIFTDDADALFYRDESSTPFKYRRLSNNAVYIPTTTVRPLDLETVRIDAIATVTVPGEYTIGDKLQLIQILDTLADTIPQKVRDSFWFNISTNTSLVTTPPSTDFTLDTQSTDYQETIDYLAVNNGLNYAAKDIIRSIIVTRRLGVQTSVLTTAWVNLTQRIMITSAPASADLITFNGNLEAAYRQLSQKLSYVASGSGTGEVEKIEYLVAATPVATKTLTYDASSNVTDIAWS